MRARRAAVSLTVGRLPVSRIGAAALILWTLAGCSQSVDCPKPVLAHASTAGSGPFASSCMEVLSFDGVDYAVRCKPVHHERIGDRLTEGKAENQAFARATYSSIREIKGVDRGTAVVVNIARVELPRHPAERLNTCTGDQLAIASGFDGNTKALLRMVSSPP